MVMSIEFKKTISENIRDNFRYEAVVHSIRILRERGWSNEKIKEEILRDFSINTEVLDEMLKA